MNPDYEAWNAALVREYFPHGAGGRLACLPIDDDELKALAEADGICPPGDAIEHFVGAVKAEMSAHGGSFSRFTAMSSWRRVRDEPPYVGALSLAVLAASRMERDIAVASHNYYAQLNRLLGRPEDSGSAPGFEGLRTRWLDLHVWLDDECEGERGTSTIRQVGSFTHIGFPLSQSLLRACDRRRLPDFFRSAGLEPGLEINEDRLFILLRAWAAQPSCGLTASARSVIARAVDVEREEIAETVARELAAWDGELRDERGRRRGTIHLRVVPRNRRTTVQLVARRPAGFPCGTWHTEPGHTVIKLQPHPASDDWYAPLAMSIDSRVLVRGLRLVQGGLALSLDPVDAVPCRQAGAELSGGYITSVQAAMWEPHHAIVRKSLLSELRDFLESWTEGDASPLPVAGFPEGWAVTKQFRFTQEPKNVPPALRRFAPRILAATSLSGGLPLSRGVYLTGGEPDAHIAFDERLETSVLLDGIPQRLTGGALTLRLSAMGLKPGPHSVVADVTRTFSTVETFGAAQPERAGEMGYVLSRHGSGYKAESDGPAPLEKGPARGNVAMAGAVARGDLTDLPGAINEPVLLRSGAEAYYVVGASPAHASFLAVPEAPQWLRYVGLGDFFQFVDIPVAFAPVWALIRASNGDRSIVRLAGPDPAPPERPVEAAAMPRWIDAIRGWRSAPPPPDHVSEWLAYLGLADELSGHASR